MYQVCIQYIKNTTQNFCCWEKTKSAQCELKRLNYELIKVPSIQKVFVGTNKGTVEDTSSGNDEEVKNYLNKVTTTAAFEDIWKRMFVKIG